MPLFGDGLAHIRVGVPPYLINSRLWQLVLLQVVLQQAMDLDHDLVKMLAMLLGLDLLLSIGLEP